MRATRSTTRAALADTNVVATEPPAPTSAAKKRKASTSNTKDVKKTRVEEPSAPSAAPSAPNIPLKAEQKEDATVVPAKLTFSFEDGKAHLINADNRFDDIFQRMKCKPYEHLEQVDPFRTLTHSILGQQISWLAARAITHKFIRLFDPSLPEKPVGDLKTNAFFPSARQVITKDIPTLRTAGLSQRKAEYVLDLASRFADGRLSTQKLLEANDEELYEMLIEVRGIGRWTVDMFAIFSLRRPDILPVGDLGVQRGLLRWILSLYSPTHTFTLSPKKLPAPPGDEDTPQKSGDVENSAVDQGNAEPEGGRSSIMPAPALPITPMSSSSKGKGKGKAAKKTPEDDGLETGVLPTPFTPSIETTLHKPMSHALPSLPAGLSVSELKKRLDTKKKIKGALLTPQEMEHLTEPWRPYRSLGVYYMWALAEDTK